MCVMVSNFSVFWQNMTKIQNTENLLMKVHFHLCDYEFVSKCQGQVKLMRRSSDISGVNFFDALVP